MRSAPWLSSTSGSGEEDKMDKVKYPNITVELTDNDGNAFAILGLVRRAMLQAGVPQSEIAEFMGEATSSGDYDQLLQTCLRWVNVE